MIWIGLDGGQIVSSHLRENQKVRNIRRDPRVVLSFGPRQAAGEWLDPHVILRATATVEPSPDVGPLLDRLAKVYVGPDADFPVATEGGFLVRYAIDRIAGKGPWVPASS